MLVEYLHVQRPGLGVVCLAEDRLDQKLAKLPLTVVRADLKRADLDHRRRQVMLAVVLGLEQRKPGVASLLLDHQADSVFTVGSNLGQPLVETLIVDAEAIEDRVVAIECVRRYAFDPWRRRMARRQEASEKLQRLGEGEHPVFKPGTSTPLVEGLVLGD